MDPNLSKTNPSNQVITSCPTSINNNVDVNTSVNEANVQDDEQEEYVKDVNDEQEEYAKDVNDEQEEYAKDVNDEQEEYAKDVNDEQEEYVGDVNDENTEENEYNEDTEENEYNEEDSLHTLFIDNFLSAVTHALSQTMISHNPQVSFTSHTQVPTQNSTHIPNLSQTNMGLPNLSQTNMGLPTQSSIYRQATFSTNMVSPMGTLMSMLAAPIPGVMTSYMVSFNPVSLDTIMSEEDTYERNLRLNELFPPVNRGVSKDTLEKLPTKIYEKTDGEDNCNICLSELVQGEEVRTLPNCVHTFHKKCIDEWLVINKTCPVCRVELDQKDK